MKRALSPIVAALALALTACGSSETNPPPAEPVESPPLGPRPVGEVLSLGGEAEGVVVDSKTGLAAVALRDPDRIDLVDVGQAKVVDQVATPESARHLSLAEPGVVLAPIEYEDTLLRIELPQGRVTPTPTGDFPHDAALAENGRVFVGDEGGDTITVLEGEETIDTLPAPEQPGGVAISRGILAVVAVAAREVAFYDTETLEQLGVEPGGAGPSHVVAGDDGRFYVTDTGGDAILIYEGLNEDGEAAPRLLDRTNLPGSPYGIAIDPKRDRLWVTRTAANRVVELEITELAPKIINSFPTVRQPNSVGVDERTGEVVVAGRGGDLQIFDPAEEREGG